MHPALRQPGEVKQRRLLSARFHFVVYLLLLACSLLIFLIGYVTNMPHRALIALIALGLISLYLANRSLTRFYELSAPYEPSTLSQTFNNPKLTISIAYEIPPEIIRPGTSTRMFNAVTEALNHHFAQNGSAKNDDLKTIIFEATKSIVMDELQARFYVIRILGVEENKPTPHHGIIIGNY